MFQKKLVVCKDTMNNAIYHEAFAALFELFEYVFNMFLSPFSCIPTSN